MSIGLAATIFSLFLLLKVVSVKHNKHVKFGFEVATVARTYYMVSD